MENLDFKHPRIGIGVMLENNKDEILLGLRQGSHGEGEWCFPGGHLEKGETFLDCVKREVKEETGLVVGDCQLISISEDFRYLKSDGKHYITIGMKVNYKGGEVKLMEPEKIIKWQWFSLDNLPDRMLEGTENIIKNYLTGKIY